MTVAWFPARYLGAVTRGVVVAVRCWRRWVTVRDYRQAAEQAEKLADKFTEIRALTLFRWKVTGAALMAAAVIGTVARLLYGRGARGSAQSCCRSRWPCSAGARTAAPGVKPYSPAHAR